MQTTFSPAAHPPAWMDQLTEQTPDRSGIALESVGAGEAIEIDTVSRTYSLESRGGSQAVIEGHPLHCPVPVAVTVVGSSWGGSLLKPRFIGCGMHLEYFHPEFGLVRTSRIRGIRRVNAAKGDA
jgi:hypothetical protein